MSNVSWGKPSSYTIFEIRAKEKGKRFFVAKLLVSLAAWIINSKLVCKETLPVLEAE